jgi:hypothetical protein
MRVKVIDV